MPRQPRPRRPGRSTHTPAGLTEAKIVAAALAIIDARGLAALSMRVLGQAVGTSAMALYFHTPNKEALLAAVGRYLIGLVPALVPAQRGVGPPPEGHARDLARTILEQLREVYVLHRNAYVLVESQLAREEGRAAWATLWPHLSPERAELLRITLVATARPAPRATSLDAELLALFFG